MIPALAVVRLLQSGLAYITPFFGTVPAAPYSLGPPANWHAILFPEFRGSVSGGDLMVNPPTTARSADGQLHPDLAPRFLDAVGREDVRT